MRTTIDIDRDLLERAKAALDAPTYKATIEKALEDVVERGALHRAVDELKGSDLSWDLDELLAYRRLGHGDAA